VFFEVVTLEKAFHNDLDAMIYARSDNIFTVPPLHPHLNISDAALFFRNTVRRTLNRKWGSRPTSIMMLQVFEDFAQRLRPLVAPPTTNMFWHLQHHSAPDNKSEPPTTALDNLSLSSTSSEEAIHEAGKRLLKTLGRLVEEAEEGRSNLLLPEGVPDEEDDVESAGPDCPDHLRT
jgi:hypothetical protein